MVRLTKIEKIDNLKKWCKRAIQQFREEYQSLDSLEKSCVQKSLSLLAPSQIEIFWISHPIEYQLILFFHDPERKDQEVIVNGPYQGHELESEVIKLMEEPRWKRKARYQLTEDDKVFSELEYDAGNQERKYSDYFADVFPHFLHSLRIDPTIRMKKGFAGSSVIGNEDCYRIIKGNLVSLNKPDLLMLDYIEYARQDAKRNKDGTTHEHVSTREEKSKKYLRFAGAYYYPGVYIGNSFELSFKEKIYGPNILEYPRFEHKFFYGRKKGYFDKFGLVLLQCNSEADVIKKLNLIFAISLLKGIPVLSVRSTELLFIKIPEDYDAEGKPFGGYQWRTPYTKRFTPSNFRGQRKTGITLAQMQGIIKIFKKIENNGRLSNDLLSLIESYTHLHNKEYSQSFLYSWMIIEKDLTKQFEQILNQRSMTAERKGKFADADKWSSDSKIEFLNLYEILNDDDYQRLINCNKKRNKFVHDGKPIEENDAEFAYDLSFKIVERELFNEKE